MGKPQLPSATGPGGVVREAIEPLSQAFAQRMSAELGSRVPGFCVLYELTGELT